MRFEQIEEIGRGGMGKIYTAFSSDLNRRVILKILHPALSSDPHYQARLKKEAEILARLTHPNIVSFIGYETVKIDTQRTEVSERGRLHPALPVEGAHVGTGKCQQDCARVRDSEHPGTTQAPAIDSHDEPCLVMEQIDGVTLQERLDKKGRMTFSEVLPLFLALCDALGYLHQQSVFHLDLNPGNLLLNGEGRLFLTDFGIASIQKGGEKTSPLLDPMGTLPYSSPEQVKGENCDGRSDLYALGMILYAILDGKAYFSGMGKKRMWGELVYESRPFRMVFPEEVPPWFQNMIRKLASKKREERYSDIKTLLQAFHRQAEKQAAPLKPQSIPSLPSSKKERGLFSEKRMILAAGIVVVLLAFLFGEMAGPVFPPDSPSLPSPSVRESALPSAGLTRAGSPFGSETGRTGGVPCFFDPGQGERGGRGGIPFQDAIGQRAGKVPDPVQIRY